MELYGDKERMCRVELGIDSSSHTPTQFILFNDFRFSSLKHDVRQTKERGEIEYICDHVRNILNAS